MKKILIKNIFLNLLKKSFININEINKNIFFSKVININKKFVIIDANLKSEIIIQKKEFKNNFNELEVNIGDKINIFIDKIDDGFGNIIASRKKAKFLISWYQAEKAMNNNMIIQGIVRARIKGGISMYVNEIDAFLPKSLLDVRKPKNNSNYEGKILNLKVLKLDYKRNNIIVSRKATILRKKIINRVRFFRSLRNKFIFFGIVKNITHYGIFVNINDIDGLAHITNLTWYKIKHPTQMFFIGEIIKVKILKFNKKRKRINLGIKQLTFNPWYDLAKKFLPGVSLTGIVKNVIKYGIFVLVEKFFIGLVHKTEINWKYRNFYKIFSYGMPINVSILFINPEKFRMSLSMKRYNKKNILKEKKKIKKGDFIKIIILIKKINIFKFKYKNMIGIINLFSFLKNYKNKNIFFKKLKIKIKILSINYKKNIILFG